MTTELKIALEEERAALLKRLKSIDALIRSYTGANDIIDTTPLSEVNQAALKLSSSKMGTEAWVSAFFEIIRARGGKATTQEVIKDVMVKFPEEPLRVVKKRVSSILSKQAKDGFINSTPLGASKRQGRLYELIEQKM